jgi:sulfite reductase beta subunit-like hemoprotein
MPPRRCGCTATHGDRGNRRHARIKYLIAENGEEWAGKSPERVSRQNTRTLPRCDPILMPGEDIILSEVRPQDREPIGGLLRKHGVRLAEDIAPVERWALACPACRPAAWR